MTMDIFLVDNLYNFNGKVVLITGASVGIGALTSILFAKSGAKTVITGSIEDLLSKVGQKCRSVSPKCEDIVVMASDLSRDEECRRVVDTTIELFGKIDVLVTNAEVVFDPNVNDLNYIEKYKQNIENNLNSVVYLTHYCIRYLSQTNGCIVNNSSTEGVTPVKNILLIFIKFE